MALEQQSDHNRKSVSATSRYSENNQDCFNCNICFDFANDPIVTLCGHLYCWPCIYMWFRVQHSSLSSDEFPQCPVCKAEVSHTTLIPLYGRGSSKNNPDHESKTPSWDTVIPPRPAAFGTRALLYAASQQNNRLPPFHNPYQQPYTEPYSGLGQMVSSPLSNVFQPVLGMFGEMVYARVFGSAQSTYTYPNSYHSVGSNSSRLRRQEMQVDKSLSRVTLFLLCCFFLCLLLF